MDYELNPIPDLTYGAIYKYMELVQYTWPYRTYENLWDESNITNETHPIW